QPRFSENVGHPTSKKSLKRPRCCYPFACVGRPLSGISLLTEFGAVPLTAVMTFPERTDAVLDRSRRDIQSVCFLLVARGMPLRDRVKDDLGRERSHLSKVRITNHLALNSLPLRLQVAFRLLQLCHQPVDFCNRCVSDLLNERSNLRASFCLGRNVWVSDIANFAFNRQICG